MGKHLRRVQAEQNRRIRETIRLREWTAKHHSNVKVRHNVERALKLPGSMKLKH